MLKLSPLLLILLLPACGMKGDLYETAPPAEPAVVTEPAAEPADADKGERKTIPATPDPALSR
jgi:predicted small lipoprotein YifL